MALARGGVGCFRVSAEPYVMPSKMQSHYDIVQSKVSPLVSALSQAACVKGVLCFGSYAMGAFDDESDIDLNVYCHPDVIPSAERRNLINGITAVTDVDIDHKEDDADDSWSPCGDRLRFSGVQVDICYNTTEWISTVVARVTLEGSTSIPELPFRPYTMLGLLANSIILYEADAFLSDLVQKIHPFPPKLKANLLSQSLPTLASSLAEMRDYVKRGIAHSAFHFQLQNVMHALETALFAINERYNPAAKRVEQIYATLDRLPPDFLQRYAALLETPLTEKGRRFITEELGLLADQLSQLAEEEHNQSMNHDKQYPTPGSS